ncbi:MAG TPA: hypothetical protein DIW47_01665 [Bacteroidetes bacterium]|nr:hypothetical protein [Bacteroidota bacterium]
MIQEWLNEYRPTSLEETKNALREIMQEIALAGLYRSGFYQHAALYGGTALRIFHGLNRFSEDLDFSLLRKDPGFDLSPYLLAIENEFLSLGLVVAIRKKEKSKDTFIQSAFIKSDSVWHELELKNSLPQLHLQQPPSIKIKVEIDISPPLGFTTENKLLLKPFSFYVNCFTAPCLFAGKMHALLFRPWKIRVKGRDWYDLEWYIKKGIPLDYAHFLVRAQQSGHLMTVPYSRDDFFQLLLLRIDSINFNQIRDDIQRFIPDVKAIEIWSPEYFKQLVGKMKVEH